MQKCPYCGQGLVNDKPIQSCPREELEERAVNILTYINELSGKRFRYRHPNGTLTATAKLIIRHLKLGYPDDTLTQIAARKWREWKGTDMERYFRPKTLWGAENLTNYEGEL